MNIKLLKRIIYISMLVLASTCCYSAKGGDGDLSINSAQWVAIRETFSLDSPGEGLTLALLNPSVCIPSVLTDSDEMPPSLAFVDTIPNYNKILLTPNNESKFTPLAILKKELSNFQIVESKLSEKDEIRLKKAQLVLYINGDPSKANTAYSAYLNYKKEVEELVKLAKSSNNEQEKAVIYQQISDKETDWPNKQSKILIEKAIAEISALSGPSISGLVKWKERIASSKGTNISELWNGLSDRSGWITVAAQGNQTQRSIPPEVEAAFKNTTNIGIKKNNSTKEIALPLKGISGVQFTAKRVEIKRDYLDEDELSSGNWSFSNGKIISDGNPLPDNELELIPRIVTELVIAKNIEIYFDTVNDFKLIANLVEDPMVTDLRIANLVIKKSNITSASLYPKVIFLSGTHILGVLVRELPKSPKSLNP